MAYQLSDVTTKVQLRVRDTGYSSSEIANYLNDTQNDVFNEYRLPFMQTTQTYTLVSGTADITNGVGLPSNFVQAIDLVLTSDGEKVLQYIDQPSLERMYPDLADAGTGVPQYWYKYGNSIKVYPEPAAAYTVSLSYYKSPTALEDAADVPEVPSEFEELLVVGAAYRVLQVKDNYDQAGVLQNKYDEILQKLVTKYSVPQVGRPLVMRINRNAIGKSHY
jgi:hypothetical protein